MQQLKQYYEFGRGNMKTFLWELCEDFRHERVWSIFSGRRWRVMMLKGMNAVCTWCVK